VALLLDWNGNRITLAEGGESVPIGSGRYRLHLERIERSGEDFTSFRQPGRSEAEMAFMDKHAGREWKRKFKELE
jgi:hypothetical protein